MNPWWWLPVGLLAWLVLSVPVALLIGLWIRAGQGPHDFT